MRPCDQPIPKHDYRDAGAATEYRCAACGRTITLEVVVYETEADRG